jgi:sec-independent protein translocase protein TatA
MLGNLTGWHLVIILAVVVLLFGATKLPTLARSVGQSMRIFKSEVRTMKDEGDKPDAETGSAKSEAIVTERVITDPPAPQPGH